VEKTIDWWSKTEIGEKDQRRVEQNKKRWSRKENGSIK
jgi:hypothetical protein